MRLTTDLFAYCARELPKWNTISISGYHMREKGCSAVQEVAFTLANGDRLRAGRAGRRALTWTSSAPRLAFFFNGHNNVFQEVAKFRAARRMWAHIMRDRFGATNPKAQTLRFHTQTGGVTLTAQQPQNNIVRVALQGFAAVCGGTQSLHTNGYDEALALPSERAAKLALRTQQVIAHESGATDTVDPFAGSLLRRGADRRDRGRARSELIDRVDQLGGSVNAIEFIIGEIDESAWGYQERYRTEQDVVVGVNKLRRGRRRGRGDPARRPRQSERAQVERLRAIKADRDADAVERRLRASPRRRRGHREPAARPPRGTARPLLGRRGLRRDARRLRDVSSARMIASVSFYNVVVWIHVLAVVVAFGGVFAYPVLASALARAGALPAFHSTQALIWSRVVTPAMVVVLLAGIYLATDADAWSEGWVSGGFVGMILLFGIAGVSTGWQRKAAQLATTSDPAYDDLARRLNTAAVAAMVLVVVVLFLMVVKP